MVGAGKEFLTEIEEDRLSAFFAMKTESNPDFFRLEDTLEKCLFLEGVLWFALACRVFILTRLDETLLCFN